MIATCLYQIEGTIAYNDPEKGKVYSREQATFLADDIEQAVSFGIPALELKVPVPGAKILGLSEVDLWCREEFAVPSNA